MNEIPATQNIGDSAFIQTQEVNSDSPTTSLWGKLISLTADPCVDLVGKDQFVIGRNPEADIVFPENYISSFHCRIFIDREHIPNHVYIKDSSTNGTFVNGNRLTKNQDFALKHGDSISLVYPNYKQNAGAHAFIFQDPTKPLRVAESFVSQDLDGIGDRYVIEGQLGKGTFGEVRLCREISTGDMYAAKIIDLKQVHYREDKIQVILHEAELLGSLSHPGIPFMKEIIRGQKKIYIIMELVTGGDLFERIVSIGHYNEVEARSLMQNILEVIRYLHEKEIVHRDIKPENILLVYKQENTAIKVTDFGLAKSTTDGLNTYCGTPQYFAPEILERRGVGKSLGSYGKAVDMWSLGVLLYVVLAGELPFDNNYLSQQILSADVQFRSPVWKTISNEAKDLIKKLIVKDPSKRLTIHQALQHPWINNIEYSQMASQLAASQLLESSIQGFLCEENLSRKQDDEVLKKNTATDSHGGNDGEDIIADSQINDELLWKNQRYSSSIMNGKQVRLVVASSVEEELYDYSIEPPTVEKKGNEHSIISLDDEKIESPGSNRSNMNSEHSSKTSTPYRNCFKAAVINSSIFDAKGMKKEISPKKKIPKKPMIPSKNILNYFSPKKNGHE